MPLNLPKLEPDVQLGSEVGRYRFVCVVWHFVLGYAIAIPTPKQEGTVACERVRTAPQCVLVILFAVDIETAMKMMRDKDALIVEHVSAELLWSEQQLQELRDVSSQREEQQREEPFGDLDDDGANFRVTGKSFPAMYVGCVERVQAGASVSPQFFVASGCQCRHCLLLICLGSFFTKQKLFIDHIWKIG